MELDVLNIKLFGGLKGLNETFREIITSKAIRKADVVVVTGDVTDRGDIVPS